MDKLEQIKEGYAELKERFPDYPIPAMDWLISEVERLRAELAAVKKIVQESQSLGNMEARLFELLGL